VLVEKELEAPMRILVVDNYPKTSLGLIGRALDEAGATVDLRIMHQGGALPDDPGEHDGMVLLGGGQNALADAEHPYLPRLAALTRAFGEADKAVLGVCLGSQLVARGHGATNIIGRPIEFGWKTVRPTAEAASDPVLSALGDGAPTSPPRTRRRTRRFGSAGRSTASSSISRPTGRWSRRGRAGSPTSSPATPRTGRRAIPSTRTRTVRRPMRSASPSPALGWRRSGSESRERPFKNSLRRVRCPPQ
jgi:putative intracellular protease/amidase